MSDFFRESQNLSPQDQNLLELYSKTGCAIDSLPYTSEFEELVGKLRATGDIRSRSEILRRLMTLRKAGKLPRIQNIGKSKFSPVVLASKSTRREDYFRLPSSDDSERKPLIGLNADYRSSREDSPAFSFLAAGYYSNVMCAGGSPLIIPPLMDESSINDVLDFFDGVILVGGADLDPRNDGFLIHKSMRYLIHAGKLLIAL